MKIAFCLFRYFPYGGLQRDFLKIASEFQRRGHAIEVFTSDWEGDIPPGFNVQLLPAWGLANHRRALDFARCAGERLAAGAFDVVVGFNKMPGLDFYFAADPCHRTRMIEKWGRFWRFFPRCRTYGRLEAAVFAPASTTHILCLTTGAQQQYMQQYNTPAERFHLLPPGISRTSIDWLRRSEIRAQMRAELRLEASELLLLMVGSGFRTKGVDRSIEALARLPDELRNRCRLCVVGQGKAEPFQKLATRLGVAKRVHFLGARSDVPRYLLGADLLLQPSVTEAAGMVLLEAMQAGLPILASEVCGYGFHIVRAGAGMLLNEPFAVPEFAGRLEAMLTSAELSVWGQNGRRYAECTDLYSLAKRAADIIERAPGMTQA